MPILAPHSSDQAMAVMRDTPVIRLTLDASLQKVLEPLARDRAIALGPNISVGIIVVDNDTGTCWPMSARPIISMRRGQGRWT
jgi:penicillin-binding protein 1C